MTTPIAVPVTKAHEFIGCTPKRIRSAITAGELVAHRLGRSTVILADDLSHWVASKPPAHRKQKEVTS